MSRIFIISSGLLGFAAVALGVGVFAATPSVALAGRHANTRHHVLLRQGDVHVVAAEIMEELDRFAGACGHELNWLQENSEGVLVEAIHRAANDGVDYIIFNPAGYTHTSVALRDAMLAVQIPFVEVHITAVSARESFRHISYFSDIALGVISGFQGESYMLALQAVINQIEP